MRDAFSMDGSVAKALGLRSGTGALRWLVFWTGVTCAAVLVAMAWLDQRTAQWANWAGFDPLRPTFEVISEFGRALWWIVMLGVLAGIAWIARWRGTATRLSIMFTAMLATGLVVQLIKLIFGRHRPKAFIEEGLYGFGWFRSGYETASFPSGHAATMAVIAASLWIMLPRWRDVWVALVALIALSRLLNGAHYPSDVIAGAYCGAALTFLMNHGLRSRGMPSLSPVS